MHEFFSGSLPSVCVMEENDCAQDLVWGVLVFLSPAKFQQPIQGLIQLMEASFPSGILTQG